MCNGVEGGAVERMVSGESDENGGRIENIECTEVDIAYRVRSREVGDDRAVKDVRVARVMTGLMRGVRGVMVVMVMRVVKVLR